MPDAVGKWRFEMTRITLPTDRMISLASKPTLEAIAARLGYVPNVIRLMSLSPAVLNGFAALQRSLGDSLDRRTREGIALVVSEANGCAYCLALHTRTATLSNTPSEEIGRNCAGQSSDAKVGAASSFARKLIETRGHVTMQDLEAARDAGYSDPEILEIVAISVQFLFTNFLNTVAGTELDFPAFEPSGAA